LTDEYEPEGGFSPQQKLSVAQGLRAYTFGSAYSNGMELITGSLQPNMRADIAILDSDIFNVNPKHIKEMRVIATYMDGEEVYSM
jgi:predicted amidohydrolase YtcJ